MKYMDVSQVRMEFAAILIMRAIKNIFQMYVLIKFKFVNILYTKLLIEYSSA